MMSQNQQPQGSSDTTSEDSSRARSQSEVNIRQPIKVPSQKAEDEVRTQALVSNRRSGYNGIRSHTMSSTELQNKGQVTETTDHSVTS